MARIDMQDGISRVTLTDENAKVTPQIILVNGGVGSGKSIGSEGIVNYYYRNGYTVISLSDVKDQIEQGFSMFEPKEYYHLENIRRYGSPKGSIPTKLYHPFTFTIPKNHKLPDINFYTFNIKNIMRTDLNFIAESSENKKSIQIIIDTLQKLKNDEGLHHLVYYAENQTESMANLVKTGMRFRSDNPDDFFTKSKIGTEKTSSEITSFFKPFIVDYNLTPENCPYNLDIKKVMNDQKHYHIFTTKWIKDKKQKQFYILHLLNEIMQNTDYAKHPVLLYIEEIRFLLPQSSEGSIPFLAEEVKNTLTRMRNMGMGFACIMTTQAYRDTHERVIDSCNEIFITKLTSLKEYEFIGKALRLTTQEINLLKSVERGEYVIKAKDEFSDEPSQQKIKLFMPPHAHCEVEYNFFKHYEHYFPDKMRLYPELFEEMELIKQDIIERVTTLKDKENETKKQTLKKEREGKLDKEKLRLKVEMAKVQGKQTKADEIDDKMKDIIYQEYINATGKDKSYRTIARKLNIFLSDGITPNQMVVKRAIIQAERKKTTVTPTTNENMTPDDTDDKEIEELYDDNDHPSTE